MLSSIKRNANATQQIDQKINLAAIGLLSHFKICSKESFDKNGPCGSGQVVGIHAVYSDDPSLNPTGN